MPDILFVTSRLPFPPTEGHQLRSWNLLKALAQSHRVTLLSCVRDDDDLSGLDAMRGVVDAVHTCPLPSGAATLAPLLKGLVGDTPYLVHKYAGDALRNQVARISRSCDLVHFDMLPLMACAQEVPSGVPVVFNAHNVEHELLEARAGNETRKWHAAYLRSQVHKLQHFEGAACKRADLVLACSEVDAAKLQALGARNLAVVPNGVDIESNRPAVEDEWANDTLVFVGQMGWFPNRDGVEWFLDEVFPRVLAQRPATRFTLIGKSAGLPVPEGVAANVTVTGFVDDLRPLVQQAALYVVPLRMGSGTRLKVLEAMALGKAIVSTRIGSEGIGLQDGRDVVFADDAEAFAQRILELLDDPARRRSLGAAARAAAENGYSWEAIGQRMLPRYAPLLAPREASACS